MKKLLKNPFFWTPLTPTLIALMLSAYFWVRYLFASDTWTPGSVAVPGVDSLSLMITVMSWGIVFSIIFGIASFVFFVLFIRSEGRKLVDHRRAIIMGYGFAYLVVALIFFASHIPSFIISLQGGPY